MDVHSYRAATLQEALSLVRQELGPDAAVLHTREVRGRLLGLLPGKRQIEVLASNSVNVPSRLPRRAAAETPVAPPAPAPAAPLRSPAMLAPPQARVASTPAPRPAGPAAGRGLTSERLEAMLAELGRRSSARRPAELSEGLFHLYTDLIEAELSENLARELVDRVRDTVPRKQWSDAAQLRASAAQLVEQELSVTGPLNAGAERRRVVALVGPTGVGKTTTLAKLAANYRLRHRLRVGLITVDTYRIAAVEQLRTYADIIDLPMHVVATPAEMRDAAGRFAEMDLVLIDTAGRSPHDEMRIQELNHLLGEAQVDEVHLVLSSAAGTQSLVRTAEKFSRVGTTALIITKLDESGALAHLWPLVRSSRLPISYLTNGQNVPDDIEPARAAGLARRMLGLSSEGER